MHPETSEWPYERLPLYFRRGESTLSITRPPEDAEIVSLGLDDTDSKTLGMCTTYLSVFIIQALSERGLQFGFWDFPNLVRLNPSVPNKTRGNGALCLRLFVEEGAWREVMDVAREVVAANAVLEDDMTHPGIALLRGEDVPASVRAFYHKCLHRIVPKGEAIELAQSEGIATASFKEGLGLIGAIAALGVDFTGDQTFETIAYRDPREKGRSRQIEESLVLKADREVVDTFYNYDHLNKRVCIVPASPCPVHFGVRAESPLGSQTAYRILDVAGAPSAVTFRTNQHTDAHIETVGELVSVIPRSGVVVGGTVNEDPRTIKGGHVIFSIADATGKIDCAAYEPTKQFRRIVRQLRAGDVIRAYGSVRPAGPSHGPTINLEKMQVISLVKGTKANPRCPRCGSTLTSMGTCAGYRCRRQGCGFKGPMMKKVDVPLERSIATGFYEPPQVAWRHLYKPLQRGVA